jgi:hypothetical protein
MGVLGSEADSFSSFLSKGISLCADTTPHIKILKKQKYYTRFLEEPRGRKQKSFPKAEHPGKDVMFLFAELRGTVILHR